MIEQLLIYQAADARLNKIEKELAGSDDRKKAVSAKKFIEGVEESLAKLDARAANLSAQYEKAVADLAKLKEQEEELSQALESAGDEGEASYLIKKAEELVSKIKKFTAMANTVANEIQAVVKEYVSIKNSHKVAVEQLKESGAKFNELKASLDADKKAVEAELEGIKKKVDAVLMEKYLKKRAGKMYPVAYEINGNYCGACGVEFDESTMSKLKKGEVIECEHCGRLIYKK